MYGMEWQDFLTDQEKAELAQIEADKLDGQRRRHRIYDRCRKRLEIAKKQPACKPVVNSPSW